jgi:hypothetical protein
VRRDSLTDLAKRREGSFDEVPFGAVLLAQCLEHLAGIDGPGARFLYASIAFSLGDHDTAHDEFLRGCSLWAERSDRAEDVEPSEALIT